MSAELCQTFFQNQPEVIIIELDSVYQFKVLVGGILAGWILHSLIIDTALPYIEKRLNTRKVTKNIRGYFARMDSGNGDWLEVN